MRKIEITGFISSNAERLTSKNGVEYIVFNIGNNEFNDEKDQSGRQKTFWFRVCSFNPRVMSLQQYLVKGKPILVDGDYSDRIYQTQQGTCEIARDITANAIYFLPSSEGSKRADNNSNTQMGNNNTNMVNNNPPYMHETTSQVKQSIPPQSMAPQQQASNNQTSFVQSSDDDDLPF